MMLIAWVVVGCFAVVGVVCLVVLAGRRILVWLDGRVEGAIWGSIPVKNLSECVNRLSGEIYDRPSSDWAWSILPPQNTLCRRVKTLESELAALKAKKKKRDGKEVANRESDS